MRRAIYEQPDSIAADEALGIEGFKQRTGVSDTGLAALRRNGLKIRRAGKRSFVLGSDWHAYLIEHGRIVDAEGNPK